MIPLHQLWPNFIWPSCFTKFGKTMCGQHQLWQTKFGQHHLFVFKVGLGAGLGGGGPYRGPEGVREVETSLASSLPLLAEQHKLSMTIGLSSSGYSSECRR